MKAGDEILVPSLTAFPSIEPMIHVGAKPVFCDIDDFCSRLIQDVAQEAGKRPEDVLFAHLCAPAVNVKQDVITHDGQPQRAAGRGRCC